MRFYRVWAVVLRYLYAVRDFSRLAEFVFWPMIDIGFYGLIATWFSQFTQTPQVPVFVTSLVLWQLIYRANYEVCVNVIDEFWEQNIFNLVASPLTHTDWILAMMLSGLIKIAFTLLFGTIIAWVFFGIHIWTLGSALLAFILLAVLSGWFTGFMAAAILIYYGPKIQTLPWITTALIALFSSIYYPVAILPGWMQRISLALPTTHLFEGVRFYLHEQAFSFSQFLTGLGLALLYLFLAIRFFILMFHKSRLQGLPRPN